MNKLEMMDNGRVKIIGSIDSSLNYGEEIITDISILQLAKVWATDREVGDELESAGFGSAELENKCTETMSLLNKFPDVPLWKRMTEFDYVSVTDSSNDTDSEDMKDQVIQIWAEDLCGWNGEGILIKLKREIYKKYFEDKKKLCFKMSPYTIEIRVKSLR